MTTTQALTELKAMPEADFQTFLQSCPLRVQILLRGGMASWQDVLPQWYIAYKSQGTPQC